MVDVERKWSRVCYGKEDGKAQKAKDAVVLPFGGCCSDCRWPWHNFLIGKLLNMAGTLVPEISFVLLPHT
jgi:hypothetical protein